MKNKNEIREDKIRKVAFMYESELLNKLISVQNYIYSCIVTKDFLINILNNLSDDELENFFVKNGIESALSYSKEKVLEEYFKYSDDFENILKYGLDGDLEFSEVGYGQYVLINKAITKETNFLIKQIGEHKLFDLAYKDNDLLGKRLLNFHDFVAFEKVIEANTDGFENALKKDYRNKEKILDNIISHLQTVQSMINENKLFTNI